MPVPEKRLAFLVGARNGFLWSLLLAVPAFIALYDETCLGKANHFDPITFARTSVQLTNAHRIAACVEAIASVSCYIVLPWSLVAGAVKHGKANRNKENFGKQGIEHDHA